MRPFLLALLASAVMVVCARAGDLRNFDDAALHAIQMMDANEGWAVGDEGVVWHTIDGGKTWERQATGTRASLRSLHFLDPWTGWVAGREELPGGGSTGVLLFTKDGGIQWQRGSPHVLPGLNRVRFHTPQIGAVVGDSTDHHPTGIFLTTDGGRNWEAVAGPRYPSWLAADFQPGSKANLAVAGTWGRLVLVRDGKLLKADTDPLDARGMRALQYLPPAKKGEGSDVTIAVGQGGLVLMFDPKVGTEWGQVDLKLPHDILASWDFHAVHCYGNHIWIAGRPGSVVLHSANRGNTWEVQRTDEPLSLNSIFFIDESKGWAVGELGSILGTTDGGKTWKLQRRGGVRSAILFIHARPTGLPVDTVAWLGGEQGYLTAALRVVASDPASAPIAKSSEGLRQTAAMREAGGAVGEMLWQFPLPQHRLRVDGPTLIKGWDQLHGGRAANEMLRQMVLALRLWRPDVVITDHPDPATAGHTTDAVIAEAVNTAFKQAADPKAFPEQITQLGLKPWKPSKLYCRWENAAGAQVALDLTEPCLRLQASPRDYASGPANLLSDTPLSLPAQRYFRLLDSTIDGAAGHRDLMQGIALAHGGMARRVQEGKVPELAEEVRKSIQTRRNLQAMAESFLTKPNTLMDGDKLLAQIGPALGGLRDDQAAPAAYALAHQYARVGQWGLAREIYQMMVDRYPAHPLTADACRWIIRHNSSSEARRRHELGQFLVQSQFQFEATSKAAPPPKPDPRMPKAEGNDTVDPKEPGRLIKYQPQVPEVNVGVRQLGQQVPLITSGEPQFAPSNWKDGTMNLKLQGSEMAKKWYQRCLDLEPRLAGLGPMFKNDPSVQFCLQSSRRHLGDFETPRQWFANFFSRQPPGPWRSAAEAELWLADRRGDSPKPVMWCKPMETRPFLDGKLEEACWQAHKPNKLRNSVGKTVKENKDDRVEEEYPTEVWLAYDREYLYLACRCGHPAGKQMEPMKDRARDADVRPFDRISLMLDLDRDYSSYFHLQIDQRGCVCEDCWGDLSWNPRWFVAVHSEAEYWQVEAAIPLQELTGERVTFGKAWACNVARLLPGRGVQAFSTPADIEPRPEGMGLLIFMQDPQRTATAPGVMPKAP